MRLYAIAAFAALATLISAKEGGEHSAEGSGKIHAAGHEQSHQKSNAQPHQLSSAQPHQHSNARANQRSTAQPHQHPSAAVHHSNSHHQDGNHGAIIQSASTQNPYCPGGKCSPAKTGGNPITKLKTHNPYCPGKKCSPAKATGNPITKLKSAYTSEAKNPAPEPTKKPYSRSFTFDLFGKCNFVDQHGYCASDKPPTSLPWTKKYTINPWNAASCPIMNTKGTCVSVTVPRSVYATYPMISPTCIGLDFETGKCKHWV